MEHIFIAIYGAAKHYIGQKQIIQDITITVIRIFGELTFGAGKLHRITVNKGPSKDE
jgi:hypothetical protein